MGNHTSPHYQLTLQSARLGGRSLGATMATASCALPPPSRKPDAGLTCRAGHEDHVLMACSIGSSGHCSAGWVRGKGAGSCRQTAHGQAQARAACSGDLPTNLCAHRITGGRGGLDFEGNPLIGGVLRAEM